MNKARLNFDLILLGDPASGKDTQAALLMKKYSLKPVESGKYWRAMAKKNNFEGRRLRKTMSLGHPTPVVLMKKFLKSEIAEAPKNKDLIFIGNPRLKPEAQLLKKLLGQKRRSFFVIYIRLPEKEIIKRSLQRIRIDKEAKKQYIANRISWHKNQVSKTVKYFQSLGKLRFINGSQTIRQVSNDIEKAIQGYSLNHPHPSPSPVKGEGSTNL